jgi:hypothetical protein
MPHALMVPLVFLMTSSAPREQCEDLLNEVLPLAEKHLNEHREFYPFGATRSPTGQVTLVMASDGSEHPLSAPLMTLLRDGFRLSAAKREVVATALVYDVGTIPPGSTQKTDAVAIKLDHRDHYSVVVLVPYAIVNGKVRFATAFTNAGKNLIFPSDGG